MCVFGLVLSEGFLLVRFLWWCVRCCVKCLSFCWSWSNVVCCVVKVSDACGVSIVLSFGGSFLFLFDREVVSQYLVFELLRYVYCSCFVFGLFSSVVL